MRYKVDIVRVREGIMTLQGWAFGKNPETRVAYAICDEKGNKIDAKIVSIRRDDVAEIWFKDYLKSQGSIDREFGFDISFPYTRGNTYYLVMKVDGRLKKVKYNDKIVENISSVAYRKREKLKALMTLETVQVAWEFLRENGLRALYKKSVHKLKGIEEDYDYSEWYKKTQISDEAYEAQRKLSFAYAPKYSIVIPAYNTPEKFLCMMLDSILNQTYQNFEVCVADATPYEEPGTSAGKGAGKEGRSPREVLAAYHERDGRIRYTVLGKNLGIADNTNAAIRMATGDFIVLADHDDELTPDALYECTRALNENPDLQVLYSDEDKIDFDSVELFEPHFKSDYNPDLLRTVNYICHLFVVRRSLLEAVAETNDQGEKVYERSAYDGAQDYDLILRCCEAADRLEREVCEANCVSGELGEEGVGLLGDVQGETAFVQSDADADADAEAEAGKGREQLMERRRRQGLYTSANIFHIRKVLYHWRCHKLSTASNPEAKLYAFEAGARAVYDHCVRMGLPVEKVEKGITYGFYHTIYRNDNPLVSVIIPNKDHTEDLDKAIRSLLAGSYQNLEFIVVENNSTEEKTWKYYEKIQKEFPPSSVRVVQWEREFNYSAINNFGVQHAHGDYLLFLNNDIEMIAPDSISELLGLVQREDVGIAGAKLLYEDDTIQHGGVVVGFGGIAGHTFIGLHDKENTYMHRAKCVQDYSAVTAACMLSKRSIFDAVGGFTEELAVAFNDIDFCMKVRSLGKLVAYSPYAEFYHYESKSRGLEDTPEKVARFNSEVVRFAKRWPEILREGDPYYNPNLTLRKSNFALRDLVHEKPGEPYPLDILKGIV